jgi:hypothetical protein
VSNISLRKSDLEESALEETTLEESALGLRIYKEIAAVLSLLNWFKLQREQHIKREA